MRIVLYFCDMLLLMNGMSCLCRAEYQECLLKHSPSCSPQDRYLKNSFDENYSNEKARRAFIMMTDSRDSGGRRFLIRHWRLWALFAVRVLVGRRAAVSRGQEVVMARDVAVLWEVVWILTKRPVAVVVGERENRTDGRLWKGKKTGSNC